MENRPMVPQSSQTPPSLVETVGGEPRLNMVGALLGGAVGALVAAGLWGAFVAFTGFQLGLIGIVVGFIVGMGVSLGGRGVSIGFGIIAALFAVASTVLGNILVAADRVAGTRNLSYFEVFTADHFPFVISSFTRNFEAIDLLFYGLAIYAAFSAASRARAQGVRS